MGKLSLRKWRSDGAFTCAGSKKPKRGLEKKGVTTNQDDCSEMDPGQSDRKPSFISCLPWREGKVRCRCNKRLCEGG